MDCINHQRNRIKYTGSVESKGTSAPTIVFIKAYTNNHPNCVFIASINTLGICSSCFSFLLRMSGENVIWMMLVGSRLRGNRGFRL
jgi:hypothetical protein